MYSISLALLLLTLLPVTLVLLTLLLGGARGVHGAIHIAGLSLSDLVVDLLAGLARNTIVHDVQRVV
jgi:hypothetical protein